MSPVINKLTVYSEIKKSKRLISSLQGRRKKRKAKFTVIATKINERNFKFSHTTNKCNLRV